MHCANAPQLERPKMIKGALEARQKVKIYTKIIYSRYQRVHVTLILCLFIADMRLNCRVSSF